MRIVIFYSPVPYFWAVPLFWTQTGYGLKPPPLLAPDCTHEQNLSALKRHFERSVPKYGPHVRSGQLSFYLVLKFKQTAVNLAEQHGKEAAITQGYREYMAELADKDAVYGFTFLFSVFGFL